MEQLKNLICHDIIETVEANVSAGNITVSVGRKLKRITLQLYRHIYEKYDEMEKAGVNQMVEEALVLDIDIIEAEHKKEVEALILDIDRIEAEHEKEKTVLRENLDRIEAEHEKEKNMLQENLTQQGEVIMELTRKLQKLGVSDEEILVMTKSAWNK